MAMELEAFSRFARTFQPGEMIFSEYEPGDNFYLIQSGRVELVKVFGDFEKTVAILQPSDMFGEMAILDNFPRTATAIALDVVKVLEFNRQNFEALVLGNPHIALKLLKVFSKRFYEAKRRFMILALEDPEARVADVFLMLDESLGADEKFTEERIFITTAEDISRWAGISADKAREVLNHFAAQQRLEIFPDRVVVKNLNDFSRFVNSRRRTA